MILFFVFLSLPLVTVLLIRHGNPFTKRTAVQAISEEQSETLKQGCVFGLSLGAFFLIVAPFGNVIPLPAPIESLVDRLFGPVLLSLTVITFIATGFRTQRLTGRLRDAMLAGMLAGVLAFALFGLSFIVIDMVFFDIVSHQPEKIVNFARSGYQDMRAYLFASTVRAATVLTFVGGAGGAVLGTVGGLGSRKLLQRRMA